MFADPGEEGEAGGVEHPVGDDCRPDGVVQDHDDAQQKAEDAREAHGEKALSKVTEAKKNGGNEDGDKLAVA